MDRERISRFVRPEDIPLMDARILGPIVNSVAEDMHATHPDQSVDEWESDIQKALLRGDLVIVIDDVRKQLGILPGDDPVFAALQASPRSSEGDDHE